MQSYNNNYEKPNREDTLKYMAACFSFTKEKAHEKEDISHQVYRIASSYENNKQLPLSRSCHVVKPNGRSPLQVKPTTGLALEERDSAISDVEGKTGIIVSRQR